MAENPTDKLYTSALSPEYALLGLLAQGSAHGYELYQRLTNELGQVWHLSMSQAYNILTRLEAKGYVSATLQEQARLPSRRMLHLTPAGRQRFERWLHTPSGSSVRSIRLEFLTRLYFARLTSPQLAHHLIDIQVDATRQGLEHLVALHDNLPEDQLVNRLSLELRISQLESVLEWLRSCYLIVESH
jgi:DNA-binding PadR family transcriptional regulator